jgi:hypothetical protein
MSGPYADPFINFGSLDLDLNDGDRPTWPPAGTALFFVEDKYEPLFTSATWTIVAVVDGDVFSKSSASHKAHTDPFIKRWTRQLIRMKYERLRQLGVDADAEYVKWGGDPKDLEP